MENVYIITDNILITNIETISIEIIMDITIIEIIMDHWNNEHLHYHYLYHIIDIISMYINKANIMDIIIMSKIMDFIMDIIMDIKENSKYN